MATPETAAYHAPQVSVARADLALALRAAAHYGLSEGICNHFSLAVPGDAEHFLLNPRGLLWNEVTAADMVMVDAAGQKVAGEHEVEATAMMIHAAVHRLGRAPCVLHTHMPYVTALAVLADARFDTSLSQNALRFRGRVQFDIEYHGLALDASEGERLARSMQGRDIAFLSNHGVIVTGAGIAEAFEDLYYLERAAMVQCLAMCTGQPLRTIPEAIAAEAASQLIEDREPARRLFAALRRLLPETGTTPSSRSASASVGQSMTET